MSFALHARRAAPGIAALALLVAPASAGALGTPTTFPRTVASTGADARFNVTRFTVTVRSVTSRSVRLSVALTGAGTGQAQDVVLAAGAGGRGGTVTSPVCRPTARTTVRLRTTPTSVTRTLTVPRPAKRRDAIRVTLTRAGRPIPYLQENVGGGGGGAELLLNGGAWRLQRGTAWGLTSRLSVGVTLTSMRFTSRAYQWTARTTAEHRVTTRIGEVGATPRFRFTQTMGAREAFRFRRQPSWAIQRRPAPWALDYGADIDGAGAWTLRVPMAAWAG